jgi:hypothetical protein
MYNMELIRIATTILSPYNNYILIKIGIKKREQGMDIEGSKKEKNQITYNGKPIKIIDFSTETLKVRRAWSEVF